MQDQRVCMLILLLISPADTRSGRFTLSACSRHINFSARSLAGQEI